VTSEEAKQILLLYRAHSADAQDAEMADALEQVRKDPALQQWFDHHRKTEEKLRQKFAELSIPADLKEAILAGRKIVRPAFWRPRPAWLAAAAALVFILGLTALWLRPGPLERFAVFRARMVRTALHDYRMEIVTNDLRQVQTYLEKKGGPVDYAIPKPLRGMRIIGGGHIPWGNEAASMLCFDRGDKQMLFLFVVHRSAIKGEPGKTPELAKISRLQTASWSDAANTYVLAGPDDPDFIRKYGPAPP
jgi:hypothetical protein